MKSRTLLLCNAGFDTEGLPHLPVAFTSDSSVMISALVTPQTSRHQFHLFSMGPPRHSAHETWCFRFITRTKIPPFIFQRLGLHYIVIVSSNGSLSHLGHWCCTEIYDFCFSLVALAWKLSHRSMSHNSATQGHVAYLVYLLALLGASPTTAVPTLKWHGPVVNMFFVWRTRSSRKEGLSRMSGDEHISTLELLDRFQLNLIWVLQAFHWRQTEFHSTKCLIIKLAWRTLIFLGIERDQRHYWTAVNVVTNSSHSKG